MNVDGSVADPAEDAYDHSCVLLGAGQAHRVGNPDALALARETFAFLDAHLEDDRLTGFLETPDGQEMRRSNPHMHLLEAFLAWHTVTGEREYLLRAARIIGLFRSHFFDPESWTLGEFFDEEWKPAPAARASWTEPGHHFEWASLLVDFAEKSGQKRPRRLRSKTLRLGDRQRPEPRYWPGLWRGVAAGAAARHGVAQLAAGGSDQGGASRSTGPDGPDLKPEIEARVGRLFRWHIDPAPRGLWIDQIDERGRAVATEVPASIFYHLVSALTQYLDRAAD